MIIAIMYHNFHKTFHSGPYDEFIQNLCVHVRVCACVCVRVLSQTLWDPMDYSSPGSSIHGIL